MRREDRVFMRGEVVGSLWRKGAERFTMVAPDGMFRCSSDHGRDSNAVVELIANISERLASVAMLAIGLRIATAMSRRRLSWELR
jgi:hypothetical protein